MTSSTASLNIPHYGVGTWLLKGEECTTIVRTALELGVRLIDTASMYENEAEVGAGIALVKDTVPRETFYVVSKLDTTKHSYDGAIASVKESLAKLGIAYLDLILIHTPRPGGYVAAYKGLVECQRLGLVKSIGVSNFGPQHVDVLLKHGLPLPAFNEFEVSVWNQMPEMRAAMERLNIPVIGYCPLARGQRLADESTAVATVAKKLGTSQAMVALRWSITRGLVTIPKTANVVRLREMIATLLSKEKALLDAESMALLNASADEQYFASQAVKAMWEPVVTEGPNAAE